MALTRKLLNGMGLTSEQIDTIIEAHTETVNGLKADVEKYKADAEALPGVQKELDAAKKEDWKAKYESTKTEYDGFKKNVETEKSLSQKTEAVRAYYESKGITGKNLDIAMRGSRSEIEAVELNGTSIKDATALDALVKGDFSGLVSTVTQRGTNTATPPTNTGTAAKTKEEIMKIKDPVERQKEWANLIINKQKGD